MVENVPCNVGDEGSIPDMRKIPHATGPLSLYATTKTRHSQIRKKETYSVHIGLRTLRGFGHPRGPLYFRYGSNASYALLILSHRMSERCILRDTGLIKLMIFIGSSRTLGETGFSFFLPAMLAGEGRPAAGVL